MADNIQQNPQGYDPNVQQAVNSALAEEKKKKKKKKLIIIGVIAIVIIAIIAIASSGDDDKPETKPIDNNTSTEQVVDEPDDSEEQTVPDKIKAGTAITVKDLEISYISCNTNSKNYDSYTGPESGNKVVRAEFSFKNNGSSDIVLDGFECYADGQKCESFCWGEDYNSCTLESVSAGRSLKSVEYFEVPSSSKEIELEFESDFWSSEKIIFVIE